MKLQQLLENNRAGFTKGTSLVNDVNDIFGMVTIYRAQPINYNTLTKDSYVTRSIKFAKEHAVHMANTEDEDYQVIRAIVRREDVFNASNPGEYIYGGSEVKTKSIFIARVGDDFS